MARLASYRQCVTKIKNSGRVGVLVGAERAAVEEVTSTAQTASLRPLDYGKKTQCSVPDGVTEKRRETNCRSRHMFVGSAPHSAATFFRCRHPAAPSQILVDGADKLARGQRLAAA